MSGIKRAVQAEIVAKGLTGAAAIAAMRPDKLRAETGRTIYSPASKKPDAGKYIGAKAKDATPNK
jgi:hypothetical protein